MNLSDTVRSDLLNSQRNQQLQQQQMEKDRKEKAAKEEQRQKNMLANIVNMNRALKNFSKAVAKAISNLGNKDSAGDTAKASAQTAGGTAKAGAK